MTIYLVTTGEYSSYCVIGAFSSRELAESAFPGCDIEEFVLDPGLEQHRRGLTLWEVDMRRDGSLAKAQSYSWAHSSAEDPCIHLELTGSICSQSDPFRWVGPILRVQVWAAREGDAVKAANEMRGQWVASGRWDAAVEARRMENPTWWDREVGATA